MELPQLTPARPLLALFLTSFLTSCPATGPVGHARDGDVPRPGPTLPASEHKKAETRALPVAKDLLAAHIEAAGGAEDTPRQLKIEGQISVPDQRLRETFTMWWRGGQFYLEASAEGIGETRAGYNGEVFWSEDPIYRLRELEGQEREQQIRASSLFLVAYWEQHFETAHTIAERTESGITVYDVKLVSASGDATTMTFDAGSKLLTRIRHDLVTPAGTIPFDTTFSDYRSVGGYKLAYRQDTKTPLVTMEQSYSRVLLDATVDSAKFEMPGGLDVVPAKPAEAAGDSLQTP
ncbi:MAG: hypothetical protein V3V08_02920 [Nannocystaceae bacterium]